jgi:hypothetical protein
MEIEKGEEGEVTPPRETLSLFTDIISRQAGGGGVTVCVRQPKWTRTETGPSVGLPRHPGLALVSPNSRGSSVVPVLTESTHLLKIL